MSDSVTVPLSQPPARSDFDENATPSGGDCKCAPSTPDRVSWQTSMIALADVPARGRRPVDSRHSTVADTQGARFLGAASRRGSANDCPVPCNGCILVVDDDPDLRNALSACFEKLGCTVIPAVDGVHAMECLGESLKPCLVLMDLNMPRLDGTGLAAFIRAHRCHCGLPIVSMSAGGDRRGPPLVECHHSKPFEFGALMPCVESACQDRDWLHGIR